jgi:hypothetical protein
MDCKKSDTTLNSTLDGILFNIESVSDMPTSY